MGSSRSFSPRRSGFTLIEVAIALALFVIGALAIVRIFPPALNVIRNNESRNAGVLMNETTLARFRSSASSAPEAIFDVLVDASTPDPIVNPGKWYDYPAAIVNSASKSQTLPKAPTETAYSNSALGHFRYIYGEPHYIGPSKKVLLNYPKDNDDPSSSSFISIPYAPTPSMYVDRIIEGVQINASGYLDFSDAHYAGTPSVPFRGTGQTDPLDTPTVRPPNDFRATDGVTYYVTYRWRECTNSGCTTFSDIKGVNEEPMTIPKDTAGYNTSTDARVLACSTLTNTANRIIPGGVQVRVRQTIASGTSGIVIDSSKPIISAENTSSSGVTVYFNYLAADWRNLVDDSAPGKDTVHVPIDGVTEDLIYGFLTSSDQTATPTVVTPDVGSPAKRKKARQGEIEFPGSSTTIDNPRVRTIYQTADGWAHQPSVAPRHYIPYSSNRGVASASGNVNYPREPWREYSWDSSDNRVVYFHPSEAGKTVSVTFISSTGIVTRTGTIDESLISKPASVANGFVGPGNTGARVARLFLTDASGTEDAASSILSVQGLSLQARTAWLNNDRYNQVIVPGLRNMTQTAS